MSASDQTQFPFLHHKDTQLVTSRLQQLIVMEACNAVQKWVKYFHLWITRIRFKKIQSSGKTQTTPSYIDINKAYSKIHDIV